jgi:hypothetical protein
MRTLTEKYNGVLKGLFSKDQFLRDARMEQSHFITQHNSYGDAVNILLNKGLISEGELNKYGKFAKANSEAMKLSKEEGKKKYVEEGPGETFVVSNSYDDKKTIASFENGRFLSGKETLDEIDITEKMGNPDHTAAAIPLEEEVTPEEWDAAKEAARLAKYPEKVKLDDIMAMLPKDKLDAMKAKVDQEWADYLATADYDGPLEEVNLEEGPARNNPKIERLVAGINDLIAKAVDSDGDPIGVIEPDTTWQEPYMYYPIEYKNGQLKITSQSLYKNTPEVYTILSRNMEYEGIPTLRLIMRMYKKAIKQAGRISSQDIEEKKLTDAEKAGKEKIVKSLAKAGMSKKDPKTYAIATTQAKELYEGFEEVNVAYSDILEVYKKHYTQLANMNEDDAYALHELLKSYFNRLFEGTISEADVNVKRNDKLEHIPSGTIFHVSVVNKTTISGFVIKAGTYRGKDYRVHDLIAIRSVLVGPEWRKLPSEEPAVNYANLSEAKEEGYESPKPELPLDVLHHGIRFELDKKEIGNTPTKEEYLKAYKAATKNLEKDLLHYKREEGAEDAPVSKSDEMVKVKLKESFKKIIRNILSENESDKKAFNLNGKVI